MDAEKLIYWFEELGQEHNNLVGRKCASLGEMTRLGLPVPPGFAISIDMYRKFARDTGAIQEISHYLKEFNDFEDQSIARFDELSRHIRSIIESKEIPEELKNEIARYYRELGSRAGIPDVPVSVRSAGAESRPGMFETYLNVTAIEDVLDRIKKVWSSAYTARAIAFRVNKGLPAMGDELGIAVPRMVRARTSGICFTVDPVSGDASNIIVDAAWGLGEGVVSGDASVDRFLVDRDNLTVSEAHIGKKEKQVTARTGGTDWEDVPANKQSIPCLGNDDVIAVAKIALLLEERLGQPQDVEWAIDAALQPPDNLFLLQTRPAKVSAKEPESVADRMVDLITRTFYRPTS